MMTSAFLITATCLITVVINVKNLLFQISFTIKTDNAVTQIEHVSQVYVTKALVD